MASLLAHELAHALVARHHGVRVRRITLWLLGGVAELDGRAPHPRGDLLIAAAGPLVSLSTGVVFAVAAVAVLALGGGPLATAALAWLAVVNTVLAVFNLLPGAPLDGGRVLAAALWWLRGDRAAAHRTACRAGVVLGWLLVAAGLTQILTANLGGLWLAVLGWFLAGAAQAENTDEVLRTSLARLRAGDVMTPSPACGYTTQSVANFVTTVAWQRPYRTFPVLDPGGRLAGVVSLAQLARVPAGSARRYAWATCSRPGIECSYWTRQAQWPTRHPRCPPVGPGLRWWRCTATCQESSAPATWSGRWNSPRSDPHPTAAKQKRRP
jgi:Zn-dependent protease